MFEILKREFVYIWYYFDIQLRQIVLYWVLGMLIGSFVSVSRIWFFIRHTFVAMVE